MDSPPSSNIRFDEEDERNHDGMLGRVSEPLLGDEHASDGLGHKAAQGEVNSTRILLYAGPILLLCTFVYNSDISFIASNYSRRIADSLHQVGYASWILLGFTATESSFQPLYAHISQIYGHRLAIMIAASAMMLGLLFCSLSYTLWQLTLSRAVVGTGSAGLQLLVLVIINDLVDLYSLPLWRSITIITGTIASFFGGPIGAAMMDKFNFRMVFGLEFALMLTSLIGLYFTVKLPKSGKGTPQGARKRVDVTGAILLLLSVTAPLVALNVGGQILPWSHPATILLFLITPVFVAMFYRCESRMAITSTPIIPLRFFRSPAVMMVFASGLPAWFAWNQLKYGFGEYLEAKSFTSVSSTFSDWSLGCIFIGQPIGSLFSGIIIKKYHKCTPLLKLFSVINLLLYLCFAAGFIAPQKPAFAPFLLLVGLVLGILDSCWLVALFSLTSIEDQPLVYALFDLGLAVCGDFGIAVSLALTNTMIRSSLQSGLHNYPNADEIIRKSLKSFTAIREQPAAVQKIVIDAFVSSCEKAFAVSCFVLSISVVASFFVREVVRKPRGAGAD